MRFLFRVDANATIGTGHLMRCLALADVLRAGGAECIFLCREEGLGTLAQRIVAAGHQLLALPERAGPADDDGPPHAKWLPAGQLADVEACRAVIAGRAPVDWLVVDHYALDHRWQTAMRAVASRIMAIDDLADRRHDCDLLLDQSLIEDMQARYDNLVPQHCVRLLGPRYAFLRAEFSSQGMRADRPSSAVARLLVMFGGADTQNLTLRVVNQLVSMAWEGEVDVVAGPLYGELAKLAQAVSRLAHGRLHAPADNVASLMRGADLAVGSPGVSSWERCVCALPSIVIAQADNQEGIGRALGEIGAHFYLGRAEKVNDAHLSASLSLWLANAAARKAMSKAAAAVCDGGGLHRVIARLFSPKLSIRLVNSADIELLFGWRNDERIRRHSLDSRPLVLADHREWMEQTLVRPDVDLILACNNGTPVVCVRFDCCETRARVSIYADPHLQGAGFGRAALLAALDWLSHKRPEVAETCAEVMPDNFTSHALFASAGYRLAWLRYERSQEATC